MPTILGKCSRHRAIHAERMFLVRQARCDLRQIPPAGRCCPHARHSSPAPGSGDRTRPARVPTHPQVGIRPQTRTIARGAAVSANHLVCKPRKTQAIQALIRSAGAEARLFRLDGTLLTGDRVYRCRCQSVPRQRLRTRHRTVAADSTGGPRVPALRTSPNSASPLRPARGQQLTLAGLASSHGPRPPHAVPPSSRAWSTCATRAGQPAS